MARLKSKHVIQNPPSTVYCIDVDVDHNFLAEGIVAHNCHPLQWTFRGGSVALPDYPTNREGSERRWAAKFLSYATASDGSSRKKTPFINNEQELQDLLAPLMKRRLRNEPAVERVLGEIKLKPMRIGIHLDEVHMSNYRAVTKQFTDWYVREIEARRARGEDANIPPNELLVKLSYLRWNVPAPWRMEDHSDSEFVFPAYPEQLTSIHREAIRITLEELEEGQQVIIAGASKLALELMAKELRKLEIPVGVIHGEVPPAQRRLIVAACRRGEIKVLLGSMGTIAEGMNLSFASRMIVTEYDWAPATIQQLIARITRGVQVTEPKVWYLVPLGTVQEFMLNLSDAKAVSIGAALDRRRQDRDAEIPDIAQYCASLVNVPGEEQVMGRDYVLDGPEVYHPAAF